ncbi:MAG: thioredoxin fold domain-containing protein [Planctomycetota bacterium]
MKFVRLPLFVTVAALGVALAIGAFVRLGVAAEGLWLTDFKAAQAKAKEEKKYLLVNFTGSDWCGWCIRLQKEVFDKEPFKAEAPKQFVLVELDFPHEKELSPDLKKQNEELSEKYKVEGFPTVLLMDAEGQVIARTGYREGGADEYLKQLAEFSKIYQNVLVLKGKLDKTQGLDRAKLLDEIIESYRKLDNESDEVMAWSKEIITLDPDNKVGLKVKYEFAMFLAEANELLHAGKVAEAKKLLEKALALKGVPAEMRQQGYMAKFQISFSEKKFVDVVATLKLAKEAAPESRMAKRIDALISQFSKVAEAQEAADKLEAGLAKTEGIDRAKLLDKLIDAKQKLSRFGPEIGEDVKKWAKEIIVLDPDNKAGLKKKYQFKAVLADAEELMRDGKAEEANTAVDKALETAGISGDEVQQAEVLKARLAFMQRDEEQGVAHLKKALEAAPNGELAPEIKMMLRQFDKPKKPAPKKPKDE